MANEVEANEPPLVLPVAAPRPRPGLFEAAILTFAYWIVLIGASLALIAVAVLVVALRGGAEALDAPEGADSGSVAAIPKSLHGAIAWSFPVGYAAGFIFALLAFRVVAGCGWVREVGLRRVPLVPLALCLLALPGFIVMSDLIGGALYQMFGMERMAEEQAAALKELFAPLPWWFCVAAVGIGPGVVEELWCRGFLGRGLIARSGWVRGVLYSSLFFGLLHAFPPPYVLITALMGCGLHFAYIASRSLWVPIAVHAANNSVAVLLGVGAIPGSGIESALKEQPFLAGALAVGLLAFAGLALWSARGTVIASVPPRGIMVPPTAAAIAHAAPKWYWTAPAVGFCAALMVLIVR